MAAVPGRFAVALAVLAGSFAGVGSTAGAGSAAGGADAGGADAGAQVRESAARWAVAQNGLHEVGTSNCGPQIDRWQREMGLRVPPCRVWCGAFVHQAFRQAGVQLSHRLIDPNRAYFDALAGRYGLRAIANAKIQRGDIVLSVFRAGVKASHVAIAVARPRGGMLATAEGNAHNAVRLKRRSVRDIVLAARVTGDA
jgi:hypothetical protein